jgi:hypothetical protein
MSYHTIVLDTALREKLGDVNDQIEVQNEQGKVVGMYLPLEMYKYFLRNVKIPYSDDELERRMQEQGCCSLAEIWQSLGVR